METKELNYEAFRRKRARAKKQSSQKSSAVRVLLIPQIVATPPFGRCQSDTNLRSKGRL
jgi:hypothetical protein